MKLVRTVSLAFAFALAAPAAMAKGDDKKPADTAASEVDKADVQKWLAFFDKIVDAVVADKDDCTKMAKDVNALVDANKELLDKAKAAVAAGKQLPDDAKKHMMQSAQKLGPAMQKCMNDKGVQAAFMRLDVGGEHHDKAPPPKAK